MGIVFVPMFAAGIVMMFKNPGLLKSRLDAKEKRQEQSLVVKLSGLMFVVGFIVRDWVFALAGMSCRREGPSAERLCSLLPIFFMPRCYGRIHT